MKSLFDPVQIKGMTLKNRWVRSATWENQTTPEGHMTPALYDLYETLAKNEVGMIITGYANIVKEEQPNPGMMGIYDDTFIEEYKRLTDAVHAYQAKIILQVAYGGTKTTYNVGERIIFAPSEVPERGTGTMGKEMTQEEIHHIVEAFGQSARRAKASGFDVIEIHGAHTYLINQFISPYYNRRTDAYGGSLENRLRFLKEVYEAMRQEVGDDYPIFVKLTATEFFEGGQSFEETRQICKHVEAWGMDAIELSGNIHGSAKQSVGQTVEGHLIEEEGYFYHYGDIISQEVDIPVMTVGGLSTPKRIEEILNETNLALFGLSRPLLAEPDLIKRWQAGDLTKAKCVRCSKCRTTTGNRCVVFK